MQKLESVCKVAAFFEDIKKYPMLCQSCGMCEGVCPKHAVEMSQNEYKQFVPDWKEKKCIACGMCIEACPARKNQYQSVSVIGRYLGIYLARSTKDDDVNKGSSGGVVTSLLRFGLETKLFSEVLSVSNEASPIVAEPVYTKCVDELAGSKYVSAPLCRIYDKKKRGLAVTALPCQAKAIRKQSKDTFIFGLFCSKLSSEDLVHYVLRRNKCDKRKINNVAYRRGKWPGRFEISFQDVKDKISYNLNRTFYSAILNSYLFTNSGCLLCDDYFCESSDISFGDPWGRKQYEDGYAGETVVIVRSERGARLLEAAVKAGVVKIDEFPVEQVVKGHCKEIYNKKTALKQRIDLLYQKNGIREYDTKNLIETKNFQLLNYFAIYNNWSCRENQKQYQRIFSVPMGVIYVYRYLHLFLLGKRLKQSENYSVYLKLAQGERDKLKGEV